MLHIACRKKQIRALVGLAYFTIVAAHINYATDHTAKLIMIMHIPLGALAPRLLNAYMSLKKYFFSG